MTICCARAKLRYHSSAKMHHIRKTIRLCVSPAFYTADQRFVYLICCLFRFEFSEQNVCVMTFSLLQLSECFSKPFFLSRFFYFENTITIALVRRTKVISKRILVVVQYNDAIINANLQLAKLGTLLHFTFELPQMFPVRLP